MTIGILEARVFVIADFICFSPSHSVCRRYGGRSRSYGGWSRSYGVMIPISLVWEDIDTNSSLATTAVIFLCAVVC